MDSKQSVAYLGGLPAFILLLTAHHAAAESALADIRYVVGASAGYSEFSFPEKLDHKLGFPSANLTLAATAAQWQVSVNIGTVLRDADISEEEDTGSASRNDFDLTLGYQLTPEWTVFGGYKDGKTEMDFLSREDEDEGTAVLQAESYSQDGVYLGVSYSWRFEKAGVINLSLAYADIDAVNNFVANTDEPEGSDEPLEFDDIDGSADADLSGFSYALTWSLPVASNLLFQTKFKINDYQQDIEFAGQSFSNVDVEFNSLHVGIAYVF